MPNRLAFEASPYLQQHAGNPVDWFAWGPEALALARNTERPILLSVGYSACHWCHVVAHECFEDDATAALMNLQFVNIKLDREERPDIDQIYQTAHQLMTRRPGGWPLTMFLTPEGKPFFGGTYFPKRSRSNLPGFDDLLQRVAEAWRAQREQLIAQGDALVRQLADTLPAPHDGDPGDTLTATAAQAAARLRAAAMHAFDAVNGGFGGAPKFPQASMLDALLRHAMASGDAAARDAVLLTLRRMAEGGLYDHLGGGFYRYSTDAQWTIPHFEKMLYDNGPLLRLYAQAWQLSGDPLYAQVCAGTAAWLMREMQSLDGGYFSSLDADAEGEERPQADDIRRPPPEGVESSGKATLTQEGRFYVWQRDEVAKALVADEFAAFAARYGLDTGPNFEGRAWHLHAALPLAGVASRLGRTGAECEALIDGARARLFALRDARVRSGRDDKVLTAWNALAIDGMAFAARVFGEPRWAESARRALDFVVAALWRDGRLLATDGPAHLNAYLDDHAFLLAAMLELMQGEPLRAADLRFAHALADLLLDQFEDARDGGFYFTRHDHEALVLRPKSGHDGALASGNGIAAMQLQRLGHLIGEPRYLEAARRTLALFAGEAMRVPLGFAALVAALAEYRAPPTLVMLAGSSAATTQWRVQLARRYLPGVMVLQLPADTTGLPAMLARPSGAHPQAWVCRGSQCLPPVGDIEALTATLSGHDEAGF
jgi:uncharacterized protein